MRISPLLFTLFLSVFFSSHAHAGAVVARQQQMKAMQEQAQIEAVKQAIAERQQAEVQAYQQAVAQQQAAQVQAYQQAVVEYQVAEIQAARQAIMQQAVQVQINAQINHYIEQVQLKNVQEAMLKRAVEEELARRIAEQIKQGIIIKQVQDQMVAQAVMVAAAKMKANAQAAAMQQQDIAAAQLVAATRPYEPVKNGDVQEVVDIAQVWAKLEVNSKAWALLIDNDAKSATVSEFIERFRKENIRIQKPPLYYAQMIDDMAGQNPSMLLNPFKQVLEMIAIMEYDFDNGMDRDALARKLLGPAYEQNRKRLGK